MTDIYQYSYATITVLAKVVGEYGTNPYDLSNQGVFFLLGDRENYNKALFVKSIGTGIEMINAPGGEFKVILTQSDTKLEAGKYLFAIYTSYDGTIWNPNLKLSCIGTGLINVVESVKYG